MATILPLRTLIPAMIASRVSASSVLRGPARATLEAAVRGRPRFIAGRGKIAGLDDASGGQRHGLLDHVAQLPDIAGEVAGAQGGQRVRREACRLMRPRVPGEEVAREKGDVLPAVPEWWQVDPDHVEPVEKVLAKRPIAYGTLEVAIGRGHDAQVDGDGAVVAEAPDAPFLQHAQERDLRRG